MVDLILKQELADFAITSVLETTLRFGGLQNSSPYEVSYLHLLIYIFNWLQPLRIWTYTHYSIQLIQLNPCNNIILIITVNITTYNNISQIIFRFIL